jgi:hypothetical protein
MYEDLAAIVAPTVPAPWQSSVEAGGGRLVTFDSPVVTALAEINRESLRRQQARPGAYAWIFEPERQLLAVWRPDVRWTPGSNYVPWPAAVLGSACAWARVSEEKAQKLYCWSGPGFDPWTPRLVEKFTQGAT